MVTRPGLGPAGFCLELYIQVTLVRLLDRSDNGRSEVPADLAPGTHRRPKELKDPPVDPVDGSRRFLSLPGFDFFFDF